MTFSHLFSKTWFKRLLKKNWVAIVCCMIVYWVLIYMNLPHRDMAEYILDNLRYYHLKVNYMMVLIAPFVGMFLSVRAFSYLHNEEECNTVHALPVERKTLYITTVIFQILSILVIALAVFVGFILVGRYVVLTYPKIHQLSSMFTIYKSFYYSFLLFLGLFSVIAIDCIAAVIAGKMVIHVLSSIFLSCLPIALNFLVKYILANFIYGYQANSAKLLNITVYLGLNDDVSGCLRAEIFILGVVAIMFAMFLYKYLPLEKSGSAVYFDLAGDIYTFVISILAAFILTPFVVFIFEGNDSTLAVALTYAFIGIIVFIVCQMIKNENLNVFNKALLPRLGIFIVVFGILVASSVYDIFSISELRPDLTEIQSAVYATDYSATSAPQTSIVEKEDIKTLYDLQEALIDSRSLAKDENIYSYAFITYHLKNGKDYIREYPITMNQYKKSETVQKNYLKTLDIKEIRINQYCVKETYAKMNWYVNGDKGMEYEDVKKFVNIYNKEMLSISSKDLAKFDNDSDGYIDINTGDNTIYRSVNLSYKYTPLSMKYLVAHKYISKGDFAK